MQKRAKGMETVCWIGVLCPTLLLPQDTLRMLLGSDTIRNFWGGYELGDSMTLLALRHHTAGTGMRQW